MFGSVAFVQMCLETGFLRFGNLVTEEMNNFCGLGAIDEDNRGLWFGTEQLGVRADEDRAPAAAALPRNNLLETLNILNSLTAPRPIKLVR